MKKLNVFLVLSFLLLSFTNIAKAENQFSGNWEGSGTYQTEGMLNAIDADFNLTITQSENQLDIDDCWSFLNSVEEKETSCYKSSFTLNEADEIMIKDQKIGDIFPYKISIFRSNDQVSELIKFDLNGNNELLLRYNYMNMDGVMAIRYAKLTHTK